MKVTCVSCASILYLNNNHVGSIGSLVKCSKCHFIFMVHRPSFAEEPIVEDTKIDQSILGDIYATRVKFKAEFAFDEISEEWNSLFAQGVLSIGDFDDATVEDPPPNVDDLENTGLPDLSEYENVIDWGDNTDLKASSATAYQN